MRESNCCEAKVEVDSDICSCCGEHCMLICPDCDGGYVEVLADYQGDAITPRTKMVVCETCGGSMEIEAI